jgi:hypothetical protein
MVSFPLLLIPLALYNIIVFLMPGVSFLDPLVTLRLVSGTEWQVTLSDVLLTVGILMLLLEVIKGARPGAKYLTDHLLSFALFGAAAAEFVLWPKFGNSTYFLLTLLAMVEFFSGVGLRVRRRAVAHSPAVSSRSRTRLEPSEPEPPVQASEPAAPAPAPAPQASTTPSAASVAESVLLDRPEPRATAPAPAAETPRPVSSPELQAGGTSNPRPEH